MKLDAPWLKSPEIQTLAGAFARAGFELRFVGGCVRDTILGRNFSEIDAATNATPDQVIALLEAANIRAIPTGIQHGTVTALVNEKPFEITTLRKDVTTDGRHAEVAFGTSWEEDAHRRDFTMNALYLGIDGTLYDVVGGHDDCKAGRVKFIGDASARIREDYLRILRYFRFVASVGDNQFDEDALAACAANKRGIEQLSGERIQQELLKLLAAESAHIAWEKLQPLLPSSLSFPRRRESSLKHFEALDSHFHGNDKTLLKLAVLIAERDNVHIIAERLKLSGKQTKKLELWLSHAPLVVLDMNVRAQKKLVRKLGAEDYVNILHLACALSDKSWEEFAPLAAMSELAPPPFPITAKDLLERGFTEGKALGDKLKELERIWEEGDYTASRDDLLTR